MKMYNNRDHEIEQRINSEIDSCKLAYKIADSDGNTFVFSRLENGFPLFRGIGGSKHIFALNGYTVIQKHCNL